MNGQKPLDQIRNGGKRALAEALARLEQAPEDAEVLELLSAAWERDPAATAHVIGVTGPPGVGKSTLMNALIKQWRDAGKTVGVLAVDPSSKKSGGALLGDRIRLHTDPDDQGIFIRSMAARDRLGGLAAVTAGAAVLMRALFDIVLIETVGVGQSETEVADIADTVVFCIQPGSGDSLQFMKAGIMEVPHLVVVTKADTGAPAERALADVKGALTLTGDGDAQAMAVSALTGANVDGLVAALDARRAWLNADNRLKQARAARDDAGLRTAILERFGREGLKKAAPELAKPVSGSPFTRAAEIARRLAP